MRKILSCLWLSWVCSIPTFCDQGFSHYFEGFSRHLQGFSHYLQGFVSHLSHFFHNMEGGVHPKIGLGGCIWGGGGGRSEIPTKIHAYQFSFLPSSAGRLMIEGEVLLSCVLDHNLEKRQPMLGVVWCAQDTAWHHQVLPEVIPEPLTN